MKKGKKHSFKYADPSKFVLKSRQKENQEIKSPELTLSPVVLKDFKKVLITIVTFIALIIILYLFKEKLNLESILKFIKF